MEDTNYQIFTQEEIDNKNSPVSVKQIEFIIENLPTKESPRSDGFTGEFQYQVTEGSNNTNSIPTLRETKEEEALPDNFIRPELPWPKSRQRHPPKRKKAIVQCCL